MSQTPLRPELLRGPTRIVAGVCSGVAAHLGVQVKWVRIGFLAACLLAGAGVVLYAWLWIFLPSANDAERDAERRSGTRRFTLAEELGAGTRGTPDEPGDGARQASLRQVLIGIALLLVAALAGAQLLGVAIRWNVVWPLLVVVAGAVLAWTQLDEGGRQDLRKNTGALGAAGLARLLVGVSLVVAGVLLLLSGAVGLSSLLSGLAVAVAVIAGLALVLLPWALRFWRDFVSERTNRVRAAERADIAAHLHDSVLQTLALIQKRAEDPAKVLTLARAQERELRSWLYDEHERSEDGITEAIRTAAGEIEELYLVSINVVGVGERTGAPGHEALLQATREAMANAAKHAGGTISVYVEASPAKVEVFVRDRGPGFDPAAVSADRHGVRESIIGRMERNGGSARIKSDTEGTEVHLVLETENGEGHD
ncbi:ATP-binding protein [Paeniglutamicibacter psychrophenolicus]|uniref:ATP-binding protein n=1 Tax=Paeniglutamicibacter psychrophenolicus TaxID=257454 RepID=UPI002782C89E|nr:ATP-binding protein [Paeniglutamicibacter psychrophenolicus]MDQ0095797.1 signal transduction histidine kinase/phage shock protein PspC (stress-responsive transcriptional regulator) [Paeniglutamicibacter psychrophenolicus]